MKRFYAPILIGCLLLAGCSGSPQKKEAPVYGGTHSDDQKTAAQEPAHGPLKLENNRPELTKADLVDENGALRIDAAAIDKDGDPVQLRYAWTVNDQKVSQDPVFSTFKSGDRIVGTVTPFDGKEEGAPRSFLRQLMNAPPQITPAEPVFDDPRWTLQVKATDPDGDPLQYSLKSAPSGMSIDPKSGFVSWNTDGVTSGKYTATVVVSDGKSATEYPIEISLSQVQ